MQDQARGTRGPAARKRGIRIDLEGDGDQGQYENDGQRSHGHDCLAQLRKNQSAKAPATTSGTPLVGYARGAVEPPATAETES
jgi:hypothetical protein